MAEAAAGAGYKSKAAFRREALLYADTWPSAAPIAVTSLLPLLGENVDEVPEHALDNTRGSAYVTASDVVGRSSGGPVRLQVRYEGLEFVWTAALGFMAGRIGGTLMPEQLAVGAYRHLYEMDRSLGAKPWQFGDGWRFGDGLIFGQRKMRRGTYVADRTVSPWEFLSSMVNELTISANREGVTLTLDLVSHSRDIASAINTTPVLDALSGSDHPNVLFTDLVVRLDDFSASIALSSADEVGITAFDLVLANGLAIGDRTKRTGLVIEEPERAGKAQVTGRLVFPRHTSNTYLTALRSGTIKMADLQFTGDQIGATGQNYALNLYLASLKFDAGPIPIDGPGLLGQALTFTCYEPTDVPAGFPVSNRNGPLLVEVQSAEATHPLV